MSVSTYTASRFAREKKKREEFEHAVGAFIIAFNRIENAIRGANKLLLKQFERDDIYEDIKLSGFHSQVQYLRIISLTDRGFPSFPYKELIALNEHRNRIAHGHYFYSAWKESRVSITRGGKISNASAKEIRPLVSQASDLADELEAAIYKHFCR